jgi:DNA-binding IclR family transcriptional regulator
MEPARGPCPVEPEGRPEDFVQSVGRALRVLEVVGRRPGLPVKTIARLCALNISTTYHLVRTLAYEGYVVRLPDGTYVIGDAVARRFHDLVTSLERPPEAALGKALLAALTPSQRRAFLLGQAEELTWAVVAARDDDIPPRVCAEVVLAAADLAGGPA